LTPHADRVGRLKFGDAPPGHPVEDVRAPFICKIAARLLGPIHAKSSRIRSSAAPRLTKLQQVARKRKNTFEALMEATKVCSLGSMSQALYEVGGE